MARYYVKTVYRYGRVSPMEEKLLRLAEGRKQHVLSDGAVDRFVQEVKDEQLNVLKTHPKYASVTVSTDKSLSQKTGLPCIKLRIGYHVVYLESVQGEEK